MPLRIWLRPDTGTLWITGTVIPAGAKKGVRIRQRAGTDSEAAAKEEAAAIELRILRDHHLGAKPAERGFADAVTEYLSVPRSTRTLAVLDKLIAHFGNVPLSGMTQETVTRAIPFLVRPGAAPGTVRRSVFVPIGAVINHAAFLGWCPPPRFKLPREAKGRTRFLMPDEAERLISAGNHIGPLILFLLCTGCRLGETLLLEWSQVDLQGCRAILWPDQTKGRARRVVELPRAAVLALAALPHRAGRVFRPVGLAGRVGDAYRSSDEGGGQIKTAWRATLRRAGLSGFGPHDCRHTFATWHYALYRDLLALKSAGGWSGVGLVERYAHLMPEGHADGIRRVWGLGVGMAVVGRVA